jgi:hypothetical protein
MVRIIETCAIQNKLMQSCENSKRGYQEYFT